MQWGLASFDFQIGGAHLVVSCDKNRVIPPKAFIHSGWDVVAYAAIGACQDRPNYEWTASLWFAKLKDATDYHWFEASYVSIGGRRQFEPQSEAPGQEADMAASSIMSTLNFAFGPVPIDDEKEDEFHERWIWLFAKATEGALGYPTHIPIDDWPPQMLNSRR
jgi:hypothetical protein